MTKVLIFVCSTAIILAGLPVTPLSDLDAAFQKYRETSASLPRSKSSGLQNTLMARQLFNLFQEEFNHDYGTTAEERTRFTAFQETLRTILQIDFKTRRNSSFTIGLNQFSDWTPEELDKLRGYNEGDGNIPEYNKSKSFLSNNGRMLSRRSSILPSSFDYTQRVIKDTDIPVLRPIKNQLNCGSCWAFAFVTLLEFQYMVQMKGSRDLSEQQFVDCASSSPGCNGGHLETAMKYLRGNKFRVDSSALYPYQASSLSCRFVNKADVQFSSLSSWAIKTDIVQQMQRYLIDIGPIYIHMYTGGKIYSTFSVPISKAISNEIETSFQGYKSGVFYSLSCYFWTGPTNHAMVIVGYGTDSVSGKPYWNVRNSWGANWGEKGYIRVHRGSNMCGIESTPFYISKS